MSLGIALVTLFTALNRANLLILRRIVDKFSWLRLIFYTP